MALDISGKEFNGILIPFHVDFMAVLWYRLTSVRKCSLEIRHFSFNVAVVGGASSVRRRLQRHKGGRLAGRLVHGAQSPISISDDVNKHGEGVHMVCVAHSAKYSLRQKM
jgi:hypothetical protein